MVNFDTVPLGPLLGMDAETQLRFEADTRAARVTHLRRAVVIWLLFYDVYQLANALLKTGPSLSEVGPRLIAITLVGGAIVWGIGVRRAGLREALVLAGALGAVMLPFALQWMSAAPASRASASEPLLTMVFATMLLLLRFPNALVFMALAVFVGAASYLLKPGNSPLLAAALSLELLSGGGVALYANYQIQAAFRRGYVRELRASQRSEGLLRDNASLAHLTHTDPLTGIGNRRQFAEHLAACARTPASGQWRVGLIMLDIDHFKRFNDHYGHPMGDACLRELAQAMKSCLRDERHLLVRYGGEEFAVLVPQASFAELSALAGALCHAVRGCCMPHHHRDDDCAVVTVSAGIALAPANLPNLATALVAAADAALYEAKHQGRDGFAVSDLGMLV